MCLPISSGEGPFAATAFVRGWPGRRRRSISTGWGCCVAGRSQCPTGIARGCFGWHPASPPACPRIFAAEQHFSRGQSLGSLESWSDRRLPRRSCSRRTSSRENRCRPRFSWFHPISFSGVVSSRCRRRDLPTWSVEAVAGELLRLLPQ